MQGSAPDGDGEKSFAVQEGEENRKLFPSISARGNQSSGSVGKLFLHFKGNSPALRSPPNNNNNTFPEQTTAAFVDS